MFILVKLSQKKRDNIDFYIQCYKLYAQENALLRRKKTWVLLQCSQKWLFFQKKKRKKKELLMCPALSINNIACNDKIRKLSSGTKVRHPASTFSLVF